MHECLAAFARAKDVVTSQDEANASLMSTSIAAVHKQMLLKQNDEFDTIQI